jgi:hypothetical protein
MARSHRSGSSPTITMTASLASGRLGLFVGLPATQLHATRAVNNAFQIGQALFTKPASDT